MLEVERWVIYYADGSTAAWGCDDGCNEHTVHVASWAQAPPFGLNCVVYYYPDDSFRMFQQVGNSTGVFHFEGKAEGCEQPVKMPLWTDGQSYWRVHDLARQKFLPETANG
jgi:hypothetical protein